MTEQQLKLKSFYEDKRNWRPPSYSAVAKFMGWASKASAKKALEKLYAKSVPPES